MKRILVFVGLKIAEVGGVLFVPYGLGKLFYFIFEKLDWAKEITEIFGFWDYYILGSLGTLLVIVSLSFVGAVLWVLWSAISEWFKWNWEKANSLLYRR